MKFILCPFCKQSITSNNFPRNRRTSGHVVMLCPFCKRRLAFTINVPDDRFSSEKDNVSSSVSPKTKENETGLTLTVIENRFCYESLFPLKPGVNRIGRYNNKYSDLEVPIHTSDPSMDRTHTLIFVEKINEGGKEKYSAIIEDNDSMTGTFVNNRELKPGEKHELVDGEVITLGATSILFCQR